MQQRNYFSYLTGLLTLTAVIIAGALWARSVSQLGEQPGAAVVPLSQTAADPVDAPFANLTLNLSVGQTSYVLGQPVDLTVELVNGTDAPIDAHDYLDSRYDFLELVITAADGTEIAYIGPGWGLVDAVGLRPTTLAPGESFGTTVTVFYNSLRTEHHLAFPDAGSYTLQASVRDLGSTARAVSSPVELMMTAPTGDDAIVWQLLRTPDAAFFVHTGRPPNGTTVAAELAQLIERYPDVGYAPAIQSALATARANGFQPEDTAVEVDVVESDGQPLVIRSVAGVTAEMQAETIQAVQMTVDSWVQAYNADDPDAFFSYFSADNIKRQKWERDADHLDHQDMMQRFQELRAERGALSLRIVRLTVSERTATAEIEVQFEQANLQTNQKLKLVQDDDGVWRVLEASCALFC